MTEQYKEILMYVGTYTGRGGSEGIYIYRMDPATGALTSLGAAGEVNNPSYLAIHPNQQFLYSVSEVSGADGKPGGAVAAFRIDPSTGQLTLLNQQSSMGGGPCYVSIERTGRYALVANYGTGSVAMLPIREDGSLGPASDFVQHEGKSVDPQRQQGPHAHFIEPDPTNQFAMANDLGLDKVLIYRLDLENGKLKPNDPPFAKTHDGAGPRHLDFHPNGRYVYVIDELDSTLIVYAYDSQKGALNPIQTITTLPEGWAGTNYPADIHLDTAGKFVYGTNRGYDTVVIYRVDEATGKVALVGWEFTQGEFPRNFALDPTGQFIFCANQNTDNIITYRVDRQTGKLTPTGQVVRVPRAVCVKFLPKK